MQRTNTENSQQISPEKELLGHTVQKVIGFPIPSWDVTYQTLPGLE